MQLFHAFGVYRIRDSIYAIPLQIIETIATKETILFVIISTALFNSKISAKLPLANQRAAQSICGNGLRIYRWLRLQPEIPIQPYAVNNWPFRRILRKSHEFW